MKLYMRHLKRKRRKSNMLMMPRKLRRWQQQSNPWSTNIIHKSCSLGLNELSTLGQWSTTSWCSEAWYRWQCHSRCWWKWSMRDTTGVGWYPQSSIEMQSKPFHQVDDTPFAGDAANTILYNIIGYTDMSKGAWDVVDGNFLEKYGHNLDGLLPETEQVICELAMPEEIKVLHKKMNVRSQRMTLSQDSSAGKRVPQPPHQDAIWDVTRPLSANDPDLKKESPGNAYLCKLEMNFVQALMRLLNIPLRYGFAPKCWCKSVTVPWIKQLRVIHLLGVDYNLSLKMLWGQCLVYQGEDNNCFEKQQHGSHSWHQAINAVHMKTLTYNLTMIWKLLPIIWLGYYVPVSSCSITMPLDGLTKLFFPWQWLQHWLLLWMSCSTIHMHDLALKHMKYIVKTAHGISEAYPLQGDSRLPPVMHWPRQWGISFCLALNFGLSTGSTHCAGTTCNVICWPVIKWMQWCTFGNGNAASRIDCKRTGVCTNLGAYTLQFQWYFEFEEVFLGSCLLAMDWWSPADGSDHHLSWNDCSHWQLSSQLYSDFPSWGLGCKANTWCLACSWW